jgi:hypothetical protein
MSNDYTGIVRVIPPIDIDDAKLTSSSVPEDDYAEYSASADYNVGDRVIVTTGVHRIYECQSSGTTGVYPPDNLVTWSQVGSTNRWKMFDTLVGTQTEQSESIVVTIAGGQRFNSLALQMVSATTVRVQISITGGSYIYDQTYDMTDYTEMSDFNQFLFSYEREKKTLVITDLPTHSSASIKVTISKPNGTAKCGLFVIGYQIPIGQLKYGYKIGNTS